MKKPIMVAVAAGITVAIAGVFLAHDFGRILHGNYLEFSDFANNALRIRDAKEGREIYGNFSRYGFYHPGPAFWYLYAAGEILLHDWLDVVPSPHFAHIITGTLFQSACATAAIFYLTRRFGLILFPFAVTVLVVHWLFMVGTPTSIWPPHVLFGPFLLLVVFGAGVADGDDSALPVLTFAGGMLVHGHVAQPLFVVPIGVAALIMWAIRRRNDVFSGSWNWLLASGAIALLFMFPILLDWAKGPDSNLAAILKHLREASGDRHALLQGVGYVLSFFRYEMTQGEVQGSAGFSLGQYLLTHWPWWGLLISPTVCGALLLLRASRERSYLARYLLLLGMASGLSFLWGAFQDGPMYEFNGAFIYAIIYLLYLLPIIAVAHLLDRRSEELRRAVAALGAITALSAALLARKPIYTSIAPADEFTAQLRAMVGDAAPVRVVLGTGEETWQWYAGWGVVLALDRMGIPWRVQSRYQFLYGERHIQPTDEDHAITILVTGQSCTGGIIVPDYGMHIHTVVCPM